VNLEVEFAGGKKYTRQDLEKSRDTPFGKVR
jgi:hypothetical protein